jgi:hypothetical protein
VRVRKGRYKKDTKKNEGPSTPLKYVTTRDAPDTVFAGYPANPKAEYRISG